MADLNEKTCSICGIAKPQADFYAKQGKCKPCQVADARRQKDLNPERQKAQQARNWDKWCHNTTPVRRSEILAAQGGGCGVCGHLGDLDVDHDHGCCPGARSCGRCTRGLLHRECNVSLMRAGDSLASGVAENGTPEQVAYLERYELAGVV